MSMSVYARRAALVVVSGGAYVAVTYLTYNYMTAGQQEQRRAIAAAEESGMSYITNPCRKDTFQHIAYGYDDQIDRDEVVMGINLLRRALMYFHANGTVLEVGAGTGRNLSYYPSAVEKVVLTDTSDQMLKRAQEKLAQMLPKQRERFETVVANVEDLSKMYPDHSFDTVVDTFGLCSFDDPVKALKEMQRVCKPGGKLLLLEHGRTKKHDWLTRYIDKHAERHAKNWGCVWNRDIDKILEESGMDVERVDTWHFGTTYYAVCRPKHEALQVRKTVAATSPLSASFLPFGKTPVVKQTDGKCCD